MGRQKKVAAYNTMQRNLSASYEVSGLELNLLGLPFVEADRLPPTLDQLFDKYPLGVIVLWITSPRGVSPQGGHWTFILRTAPRSLLYFDSYGIPAGTEPTYGARPSALINPANLKGWHVDQLAATINGCQLQAFSPGLTGEIINTCGRYALLVALYARQKMAAGVLPTVAGFVRDHGFSCVPGDDSRSTASGNDARVVALTNPILFP